MEKHAHFISDNTPKDTPNVLRICQREDGDIEISLRSGHITERGVSVRAEGSRLKNNAKIIGLFSQLIDAINEEKIQHRVGKTVYILGSGNVRVGNRVRWKRNIHIVPLVVTAARIKNGHTVLYYQSDGEECCILTDYYLSREEAEKAQKAEES